MMCFCWNKLRIVCIGEGMIAALTFIFFAREAARARTTKIDGCV